MVNITTDLVEQTHYIQRHKKGWKIIHRKDTAKLIKKHGKGNLKKIPSITEFSKADQKKLHKSHIEGGSILSSVLDTVKHYTNKVKDIAHKVVHGRGEEYPPNAKAMIEKYKNETVVGVSLHRNILSSVFTVLMSAFTNGETARRLLAEPKDKLFHISMWVKLGNGVVLSCEKEDAIKIREHPTKKGKEEEQEAPVPSNTTFGVFLEKGLHNAGGRKFFGYSAKDNNCGNWIEYILRGNHIDNAATHAFIGQDTKKILDGYPNLRKFMNTVTDLGGRANVVLEGGRIKMRGGGDEEPPSPPRRKLINDFNGLTQADIQRQRDEEQRQRDELRENAPSTPTKKSKKKKTEPSPINRTNQNDKNDKNDKNPPKGGVNLFGVGLPDFDSLNWGSLTKQFDRYNSQHKPLPDLEAFANMIVAEPKKYLGRTVKRARFYINVILKKKSHPIEMPHRIMGKGMTLPNGEMTLPIRAVTKPHGDMAPPLRDYAPPQRDMNTGLILHGAGLYRGMHGMICMNGGMLVGNDPRTWSPHPFHNQHPNAATMSFGSGMYGGIQGGAMVQMPDGSWRGAGSDNPKFKYGMRGGMVDFDDMEGNDFNPPPNNGWNKTTEKPDNMKIPCPVCKKEIAKKGMPRHYATKHPETPFPYERIRNQEGNKHGRAKGLRGGVIPSPRSRIPTTDPSLM